MRKRNPTTPGEILQDEFLKPLHLSQEKLAERIGCDYKIINSIKRNYPRLRKCQSSYNR